MTYESPGACALDYSPCRYGTSRLAFRGPPRQLDRPYIVTLGGTETYGKYIADPWPRLLERRTGRPVANLGCVNVGLDAYLNDASLIDIAARAEARVVQIVGAQNLSNRFYKVHPRRNDRFVRATGALRALYPDVDFTEFTFTGHLLAGLVRHGGVARFRVVTDELRACWLARMQALLKAIGQPTVMLWASPGPIPDEAQHQADPALIDAALIARLPVAADGIARVPPQAAARHRGHRDQGVGPAMAEALGLPDQAMHRAIAAALSIRLAAMR